MTFKDHFSGAEGYARYRPSYPDELFDYLAAQAPSRKLAWDCATGSGQAALSLVGRFDHVLATDASLGQIARGQFTHESVSTLEPAVALAEQAPFRDRTVDLITVSQALHWFDFDVFYGEVRRVACPGACLAAWTYSYPEIAPGIDPVVRRFASHTVGAYWPPERRYVDGLYRDIPFPFAPVATPELRTFKDFRLADFLGYLDTWSAVDRYRSATGSDPLDALGRELAPVWGRPEEKRRAVWRLALRLGRVE